MSRVAIAVVSACLVSGCGPDLPSGWEEAEKVAIRQSARVGFAYAGAPEAIAASANSGGIELAYTKAPFRCEQQVEAFVKAEGDKLEVLFQPKEMDPSAVAGSDCLYDLGASIESRSGAKQVAVWRRWDNLNDHNDPRLVGRLSVVVP